MRIALSFCLWGALGAAFAQAPSAGWAAKARLFDELRGIEEWRHEPEIAEARFSPLALAWLLGRDDLRAIQSVDDLLNWMEARLGSTNPSFRARMRVSIARILAADITDIVKRIGAANPDVPGFYQALEAPIMEHLTALYADVGLDPATLPRMDRVITTQGGSGFELTVGGVNRVNIQWRITRATAGWDVSLLGGNAADLLSVANDAPTPRRYGVKLLNFMLKNGQRIQELRDLPIYDFLKLVARDRFMHAALLTTHVYSPPLSFREILARARLINNIRYGVVIIGAVAGTAAIGYGLWKWLFEEESAVRQGLGETMLRMGLTPQPWQLDALEALFAIEDVDTLRESIRTMDDDLAVVLQRYVADAPN